MTDNKDIIRSIRVHLNEASGCGGCTYYKYFPEATCFLHMIADAADALEAAEKKIAELMYIRIEEVAAVVVQRMEGKDDDETDI